MAGEFVAGRLEFAFDLTPFLAAEAGPEFGAQFLDMLFERHRPLLDGSER